MGSFVQDPFFRGWRGGGDVGEWARGAGGGEGVGELIATADLKLFHGLFSLPTEEREKKNHD